MSTPSEQGPPKLAVALVEGLVADATLRESLLGDLAEDFARIADERSIGAARAWYWSQVARSAVPLSRLTMSTGLAPWVRLAVSVIVSYVGLAILVMVTDAWFVRSYGDVGGGSYVGMIFSAGVVSIALGILCAMAAGFFVALIGGRAPFLSAMALGVACMGIGAGLIDTKPETSPLWYQLGLLVIVTPSALAGAFLFVRVRLVFHIWKHRLTARTSE